MAAYDTRTKEGEREEREREREEFGAFDRVRCVVKFTPITICRAASKTRTLYKFHPGEREKERGEREERERHAKA